MRPSPSPSARVKAASEESYECPFCGFTAGVRLPAATGSDDVWIVRCVSCCRTAPFWPLAEEKRQAR